VAACPSPVVTNFLCLSHPFFVVYFLFHIGTYLSLLSHSPILHFLPYSLPCSYYLPFQTDFISFARQIQQIFSFFQPTGPKQVNFSALNNLLLSYIIKLFTSPFFLHYQINTNTPLFYICLYISL